MLQWALCLYFLDNHWVVLGLKHCGAIGENLQGFCHQAQSHLSRPSNKTKDVTVSLIFL